jgi:hypothetical protein
MPDFLPPEIAREALLDAVPSLGGARAASLLRAAIVAFSATGLELVDCEALCNAVDGALAARLVGLAELHRSQCGPCLRGRHRSSQAALSSAAPAAAPAPRMHCAPPLSISLGCACAREGNPRQSEAKRWFACSVGTAVPLLDRIERRKPLHAKPYPPGAAALDQPPPSAGFHPKYEELFGRLGRAYMPGRACASMPSCAVGGGWPSADPDVPPLRSARQLRTAHAPRTPRTPASPPREVQSARSSRARDGAAVATAAQPLAQQLPLVLRLAPNPSATTRNAPAAPPAPATIELRVTALAGQSPLWASAG